jgi:hypothetical protein
MSVDATGGRGELAPHRPVVTVAALYGAGGSVVGPRGSASAWACRCWIARSRSTSPGGPASPREEAVSDIDEVPHSRMDRLAETLGRASTITGGGAGSDERLDLQERRLRGYIEDFLARSSVSGRQKEASPAREAWHLRCDLLYSSVQAQSRISGGSSKCSRE